jgi:hypothetical protein
MVRVAPETIRIDGPAQAVAEEAEGTEDTPIAPMAWLPLKEIRDGGGRGLRIQDRYRF